MNELIAVMASVVWTMAAYATRRRESLLGTDEGYLWYGTQRLLAGEQPVRDFRAYEPGRYWWCAFVARLRGPGLVSTRVATHAAVGVALVCLQLSLAAAEAPLHSLVVLPALVLAWRPAHFKLFDSAALALVVAGGVLALQSAPAGHVALGAGVGFAAVIGINLGVYGAAAGGIILIAGVLAGTTGLTDIGLVVLGGLVGASPLLVWLGTTSGVAAAVWHARVTVPAARGTTNLPLPVPWPWRRTVPARGAPTPGTSIVTRAGMVAVPLIAVAGLIGAAMDVVDPVLTVPFCAVALAAHHHVLSRADLSHLGLAAPFALAVPVLTAGWWGVAWAAVAVSATVPLVTALHPRLRRRRNPASLVRRELGSDLIWVPRDVAPQLDALRRHLRPEEGLAAVPFGVPLVAALGRRSAVDDTYCVYPAPPATDEAMREQLERARPVLVLINSRTLDGRAELAFPQTHPLTWEWLTTTGRRVTHDDPDHGPLPASVSLWRVDDH